MISELLKNSTSLYFSQQRVLYGFESSCRHGDDSSTNE